MADDHRLEGTGMKFYEAEAEISADPDRIWAILTDAPGYPTWDSGVIGIDGKIAPGETITVHSSANPGRTFPVKVAEFQPGQRMVWAGGMPMGLFKGVRTYSLSPNANGVTRFTMREEYTGPLLPLIWKTIPDLGPSFQQFATGLKARAEAAD